MPILFKKTAKLQQGGVLNYPVNQETPEGGIPMIKNTKNYLPKEYSTPAMEDEFANWVVQNNEAQNMGTPEGLQGVIKKWRYMPDGTVRMIKSPDAVRTREPMTMDLRYGGNLKSQGGY